MPFVTMEALADESGYMASLSGEITGYIPDAVATCGYGPGGKPEFRGWLLFDSSAIPVGTSLASAKLTITTVATVGGPRATWTTQFVAADLDLLDLYTSWDSDKGAVTVISTGNPTSFDVDLADIMAVLFNVDGSRIGIKIAEAVPASGMYLQATVSSAKLVVAYGPTWAANEYESSIAADVDHDSSLSTDAESSSAHATEVSMSSAFASASACDSDIAGEVTLVSALDMEG